jgi:hypothetical protein
MSRSELRLSANSVKEGEEERREWNIAKRDSDISSSNDNGAGTEVI